MNQLEPFGKNPFKTIDTSKDSIQKFGYDDIMRMTAANNPAYAQRIIDTTNAWQKVFGNLDTYDADRNKQQSFTIQLNSKQKEFIDKALDLEALVVFKFKKTSGTYQEFYPHGRTEYLQATQENIFHLMKRMIDGAHNYPTELGATLEAEFQLIHDDYKIIWDLQKEKKGDVSQAIPDFDVKVNDLYDELYKNMLVILAENYKNPMAMLAFFDQTLVNYSSHVHPLLIQKNSKEASDITYTADDILKIKSKFNKTLKFFFGKTADADPGANIYTLLANGKAEVKCSEVNLPDDKFLIFINETDEDANVEVSLK